MPIASGELPVGAALPSVRGLAQQRFWLYDRNAHSLEEVLRPTRP